MRTAAERIRDYATANHRHVARFMRVAANTYVEVCDAASGDRCDITAAYRHAAILAEREDES